MKSGVIAEPADDVRRRVRTSCRRTSSSSASGRTMGFGADVPSMTMIEAIRDAHVVAMERDDRVVVFGEDVGYFGGVFRCTQGLQERFGDHRCFDAPINESGIVGAAVGMAAYGLRPVRRDPVRRLHVPGVRPDRVRGGPPAPPLGRRLHRAARDPDADRRRDLRRPDPLAEPRGAVHPRRRAEDRRRVEPVRRQGSADRGDRGRRPGDLPRTEAALQRPVRRAPRPADRAVVEAPARRGARGALHDRLGTARVHRAGADLTVLTYGTLVHVAEAAADESGIDAEIIDLRTLVPLDVDTIVASVEQDRPVRRRSTRRR